MELESCLEDHLRPAEVEEANVNARKLEDETARRDGHFGADRFRRWKESKNCVQERPLSSRGQP